ncbi:hypothetical protein K438DRAFT_1945937 [Mycena galopus ATCC 62051]|nr:hypothetical protein K438DRAFT_1945937 [Mycena galopus ATCC 62051]
MCLECAWTSTLWQHALPISFITRVVCSRRESCLTMSASSVDTDDLFASDSSVNMPNVNIEDLFTTFQQQPGSENRYDEDIFKTRLSAARELHSCVQNAKAALIACTVEDRQALVRIPGPVRKHIDSLLFSAALGIEGLSTRFLPVEDPMENPDAYKDSEGEVGEVSVSDDEGDIANFDNLKASYPSTKNYRTPDTTDRTLHVFLYVAANEVAIQKKWRVKRAKCMEVSAYPLPSSIERWKDMEIFDVDKNVYDIAGKNLNMIGRGRIAIFRKIGLTKAECPSLDRRERRALASARDPASEQHQANDPWSPLPPSSPPSYWSDSEQDPVPPVSASTSSKSRSAKRRLDPVLDTVEDAPVTKKTKPAHAAAEVVNSVTLTYQQRLVAHGGSKQPAFFVATSDPDYSSEVEIVE